MKLYFAGITGNRDVDLLLRDKVTRILFTYAYAAVAQANFEKVAHLETLLDSGAFSAWKVGRQFTVQEYASFVVRNKVRYYFNLDVIDDWEKTRENQKQLEQMGLRPIPVLTTGTPPAEMERILERHDYIALGGLVGLKAETRMRTIDRAWAVIMKYFPKKVHGLGVTEFPLMARYPWYSVDSTSYQASRRFGGAADRTTCPHLVEYRRRTMHWRDRQAFDVDHMKKFEREATEVWTRRGNIWEEEKHVSS